MSIKKYVLAKEEKYVYDNSYRQRSPVLRVENGILKFEKSEFDLEGKSLEEWIELNPEKLKHNEEDDSKPGSSEVFSAKNGYEIFEIKLDEDEDYYIKYSKSNTEFFEKDFIVINEIFNQLKLIFSFVEPIDKHLNIYSLKIRDLIIKASSEVETHWKELMRLNGYSKKSLNTKDYCKLKEFINFDLHLQLESYPTDTVFKPFENWDCELPSKSLEWYKVYNNLKHDRSNTLNQATLYQAINAVAAVYTMAAMRYGEILSDRKIDLKIFKRKNTVKFSKWSIQKYSYSVPAKYFQYFAQ